ncbi:helix-turn-helix domain-containing protein [Eubacterium sp. 1001713B170207_170306_E7]|uniref:helix-turn-helix domain-containing protein n=1 Tax=Eubacterium sp. 1001713B170207_170306_E7 TaxID=2787097 RepID=UPI00189B26C3|nr:helix-turn-helix domain-containing protein [Eubacterium sp. 1001713B170207_170306_E7]
MEKLSVAFFPKTTNSFFNKNLLKIPMDSCLNSFKEILNGTTSDHKESSHSSQNSASTYDFLIKKLDETNSATLTPKEAAQLLNVDVRTVRKHLKNGTLKGLKVSERCWRIAKDDFLIYLKKATA